MSAVRRQGAHTLVLGDRDRRNFPLPAVPVAVQDRLQDGRYPVGGFAEPEHGARTTDGIRIQHLFNDFFRAAADSGVDFYRISPAPRIYDPQNKKKD